MNPDGQSDSSPDSPGAFGRAGDDGRPPASRKHTSKRTMWAGLIAAVVVLVGVVAFFVIGKTDEKKGGIVKTGTPKAAAQLYDALANAASQPKLRVGMYRETFANKADADARRNPGTIASAVSELDTASARYRSVFANNYFHAPGYDVGRCIDGVTYNQDYENRNKNPRATSLKDVASHLKLLPEGHLYEVTQALTFIPCPKLGIIPGSTPDLATARLSDGVFPVTLSKQQAQSWRQKMAAANLFQVRDAGAVQKDGKTLRKLQLVPTAQDGVNRQLFDIFYQAAEIEKIKDASWQHGFIAINPGNTGSVGGFYLIDEKTDLPVYSELYGTNPDKQAGESPAAGKNIARTKQNYRFPAELTITLDTPLDFTE